MARANVLIYTVGHSTRPLEEFLALLTSVGVEVLVDVRRFPTSRRHPHFNRTRLEASLKEAGIAYEHLVELGGRRSPLADSRNTGWRNNAFRGYADYMASVAFGTGLEKLMAVAENKTVAVMCAEAVPWRCHRALIADALAVRGLAVVHLLGNNESMQHEVTPFAHVVDSRLSYPGEPSGTEAISDGESD